jgi:hypothetical protein
MTPHLSLRGLYKLCIPAVDAGIWLFRPGEIVGLLHQESISWWPKRGCKARVHG